MNNAERQNMEVFNAPQAPVVRADANSIMDVISRAASDPNTDVDKLERLLGMYERIKARDAEQQFSEAMTAAQTDVRPIAADASNPQTRSKYASYPALDRALRPIYTRNGFALSFDTGDGATDGCVRVVCYCSHKGGYSRTYHIDMPADGKGAKGGDVMTKTHATGAAMSYGQRYLLKLIFNIAVGDDVDGNWQPSDSDKITPAQAETIRELIQRLNADVEKFCKYMGVEAVPGIKAKDYASAITALNLKVKK